MAAIFQGDNQQFLMTNHLQDKESTHGGMVIGEGMEIISEAVSSKI